jgi:methyl-accepting chemotaxis protein
MEKVTQTTAATAEESAAASEELNAQAEGSMVAVGVLEALVNGARSEAPSAARPEASHSLKVVAFARPSDGARAVLQGSGKSVRPPAPEDATGTFGSF